MALYRGLSIVSDQPRTFPKQSRLLNSHDFQAVFNEVAVRGGNKYLLLLASSNNLDVSRLGLIAPKKKLRFAHERNRAKRLIRDYFRQHKELYAGQDIIALVKADFIQFEKARQQQIVQQAFARLLTNGADKAIISSPK